MGGHHGQNNIVQGVGRGAICTVLAVSNYGVDSGKQTDLSQELSEVLAFSQCLSDTIRTEHLLLHTLLAKNNQIICVLLSSVEHL